MMNQRISDEGRFKGIRTLYLTAKEYLTTGIPNAAYNNQQIYIFDHANEIHLKKDENLQHLCDCYIMSIERTEIPEKLPDNLNIVLVVKSESFRNLRPTDQVKFMAGNRTYVTMVENMNLTQHWG
jgi:hypothetical protein